MALLHPEKVQDKSVRHALETLVTGYEGGADYFVRKLSEGVGTIAAVFWPKPVVVRMSDFKSNEYATLLGGADFEPHEDNPMIGFRGTARYTHPAYAEGFALECAAMKRVRDDMGLTNVMCEIPNNVILIDEFAKLFGGFSIGSKWPSTWLRLVSTL